MGLQPRTTIQYFLWCIAIIFYLSHAKEEGRKKALLCYRSSRWSADHSCHRTSIWYPPHSCYCNYCIYDEKREGKGPDGAIGKGGTSRSKESKGTSDEGLKGSKTKESGSKEEKTGLIEERTGPKEELTGLKDGETGSKE
ncbi:hypothetical protein V3C99_003112 [Haemonchus contortus]